jgi:hypothetical protein
VLVIPEDQTYNGYILRAFGEDDRGGCRASIRQGEDTPEATDPRILTRADGREELSDLYRLFDLWLFFPDADRASSDAMRALETEFEARGRSLFCCPAQPEVEIYACVAFRQEMSETWDGARTNPRMKEEVFAPLLAQHGDRRRPGGGRDLMIGESLKSLPLLYRLCPELKSLRDRIAALLTDR